TLGEVRGGRAAQRGGTTVDLVVAGEIEEPIVAGARASQRGQRGAAVGVCSIPEGGEVFDRLGRLARIINRSLERGRGHLGRELRVAVGALFRVHRRAADLGERGGEGRQRGEREQHEQADAERRERAAAGAA